MRETIITADYLERIFREQYSRFYYYALSIVNDEDTVKDIIEDVFLGVWKNRQNIDPSKLTHYIMVSIHNKCFNSSSSNNIQTTDINDPAGLQIPYEDDKEWERKEQCIAEIEKILKEMNPRTRYVLEQFYYKHRSYKDIAAELDITTDGIKKQLVKGLTILRRHFNTNYHKSHYHLLLFFVF